MLVKVSHAADAVYNKLTNNTSVNRVEIRNQNGEIKFFKLRACTRKDARTEASQIALALAKVEKQTILWRMTNDNQWSIASEHHVEGSKKHSSLFSRFKNLKEKIDNFFFLDEDENEVTAGGK
ncbi:hypothetical protein D7X33_17740 [Butyricicoccus sp. 1XD8-22]|nr:hypothetical protein D7X33_17740 [Butyricicoccus sp. 1XD8-22]